MVDQQLKGPVQYVGPRCSELGRTEEGIIGSKEVKRLGYEIQLLS